MGDEQHERISVSKNIQVEASRLFEVLTSPKGHVAIDGSGMLVASDQEAPVTGVGDTFQIDMHQDAFGDYRIENVVTVYEQDRALEWRPQAVGGQPSGVVYGYRLTPAGLGTNVVSYYDWSNARQQVKDMGVLPRVSQSQIEQTLVKLEAAANS